MEGLPELIAALEAKLARENGIAAAGQSRVFVTAGGNLAFMNAVLAITDPGDEVILVSPFYFNHEMAIVMAGAVPVAVPATPEYQLDLDAIARAITPRTRAVVTVSPNSTAPTGSSTFIAGARPMPRPRTTCASCGWSTTWRSSGRGSTSSRS